MNAILEKVKNAAIDAIAVPVSLGLRGLGNVLINIGNSTQLISLMIGSLGSLEMNEENYRVLLLTVEKWRRRAIIDSQIAEMVKSELKKAYDAHTTNSDDVKKVIITEISKA